MEAHIPVYVSPATCIRCLSIYTIDIRTVNLNYNVHSSMTFMRHNTMSYSTFVTFPTNIFLGGRNKQAISLAIGAFRRNIILAVRLDSDVNFLTVNILT